MNVDEFIDAVAPMLKARNVSNIPMGAGEYTINVLDRDGAFVTKSTPFLAH